MIPWDSGGGNIHLTFTGQGNGSIAITSDTENLTGKIRSKVITVTTTNGGSTSKQLIVKQTSRKAYVNEDNLIITSAVNASVSSNKLTITDSEITVSDKILIIQ